MNRLALALLVALFVLPVLAIAQEPIKGLPPGLEPGEPGEHPLMPAIRWCKQTLPKVEAIKDYSAILVARERVGGQLNDTETMSIKIRHKPFSVYIDFLGPERTRGQEVLYIEGQNNGRMWAHKSHLPTTLAVFPDSKAIMFNRRYPVTEIGLATLLRRLLAVAEHDAQFGESEVKYFSGAKLNGRSCTVIQVIHPVRRKDFTYYRARVFIDDELLVPIRIESQDWPTEPGAAPEPIEEYTYLDLKLNVGLTDEDFSTQNPSYRFR